MKKIKEKPTLSERIKEKAVSTPRELLRKGLDDGSERLRTQLRDTAQHGQADEYGGDTIHPFIFYCIKANQSTYYCNLLHISS